MKQTNMAHSPKYQAKVNHSQGPIIGDYPVVFQFYGTSPNAEEQLMRLFDMLEKRETQDRFKNPSRRQEYWKEKMIDIDWQSPFSKFIQVYHQVEDGGAAAFLIHNAAIADDLFKKRLHAYLRGKTGEGNFRTFQIGFMPYDKLVPINVLNKFAYELKSEPLHAAAIESEIEQYAQKIIEKLCQVIPSPSSGHILLFQVSFDHTQGFSDHFLPWFANCFWAIMIEKLNHVLQDRRRAKFIFLLENKAKLTEQHLTSDICCFQSEPDLTKVIPVFLCDWSLDDISKWVSDFGNLTDPDVGLQLDQVDQIVNAIYKNSLDGRPRLVYTEVLTQFEAIYKGNGL